MGMQVLKSPQGTEGWDGAQDERGKRGGEVSGMICPPVPPHCAPNFPAFLGAEGRWRDMGTNDSLPFYFILSYCIHSYTHSACNCNHSDLLLAVRRIQVSFRVTAHIFHIVQVFIFPPKYLKKKSF